MRWHIAIRYLLSHKRQTLVCLAGVVIGVTIFLGMFSMMWGFREKFIIETVESTGHIVVRDEARQTRTPILERAYPDPHAVLALQRAKPREQVNRIRNPAGLMARLRALPGVTAVAGEVDGDAIAAFGTRTARIAVLGIDPEQEQRVTTIGDKLTAGSFDRLRATADGVVVGRGLALVLGCDLDDTITLASPAGGRATARVVSVFATGVTPVDYGRAYMLLNNAQTLLDKKNIISRILIRTADYTTADALAAQIESLSGYRTEGWQESNANFLKIFATQNVITGIITAAILIVAAFGVLNILIMAVLERVNDIAILKSFGYSRRDITIIFLIQGAILGLIGSSLGLAFGKLLVEGLRRLPVRIEGLVKSEGLLMSESPRLYVLAFVCTMAAVLIASVYPARRAARYDPVEVIRGAH